MLPKNLLMLHHWLNHINFLNDYLKVLLNNLEVYLEKRNRKKENKII